MSRPALRLVEPLTDAMEFPEGKSHTAGLREITNADEVHSHLQLYLMWPDYSSSFIKVAGEMVKATISVDQALGEFDQLFITTDENTYLKIKNKTQHLERIFIEVFGITFGFDPIIHECINEYSEEAPCFSIQIPTKITRYNMRGLRRININTKVIVTLQTRTNQISGRLLNVSANTFCIKIETDLKTVQFHDKVNATINGITFEASISSGINNTLLLKPLTDDSANFGNFFDIYIKFGHPTLKSRFSFSIDPSMEIMNKTGQAKKFAGKEISTEWTMGVQNGYIAAKEAKDVYTASYIALDRNNEPVGISNLAKAFMDSDGTPVWSFHGLGTVQSPHLIEQTCALYLWRVDYLLSKEPKSKVIMWFDKNGKWLEKVYIKFKRMTPDQTEIWPIKHNRYVNQSDAPENLDDYKSQSNKIRTEKNEIGSFKRRLIANGTVRMGFGVSYLNLGGNLNSIHFLKDQQPSKDDILLIQETVDKIKPKRFFVETPAEMSDLYFNGYNMHLVETVSRQCSTHTEALKFFSSSLEHSKAVVKKKYDS